MRTLLLLLVTILPLFGAKILSYNVYERDSGVDMMITFDTPYSGLIKRHDATNKIIIKLADASIESPKIKSVDSRLIKEFTITPMLKETQIIVTLKKAVSLKVSKTTDAFGLRLRFLDKALTTKEPISALDSTTKEGTSILSNLPTKSSPTLTPRYITVVLILFIMVIALFILKKRVTSTTTPPKWFALQKSKKDDVSIRFQKAIDSKNRVVMLDVGEQSYLMVVGNSNLLLDKFDSGAVVKESEFESVLDAKRGELDKMLQIDSAKVDPLTPSKTKSSDDPLYSYKQKASNLDFPL